MRGQLRAVLIGLLGTFLFIVESSRTFGQSGATVTTETRPSDDLTRPIGFGPASAQAELKWEAAAIAVPTPADAKRWLRTLTAEPHVAGTPADYQTALFVRDKLREWGWKADLVEYEVLLNYPNPGTPQLSIVRPGKKDLQLNEAPVATDSDSASSAIFGAFNGYGVSGQASGQLVYVNYGRPEDYQALEKLGLDVKDKIVLARYGGLFRGLKVLNAQKRGAKGILIYSDPADDGYAKGDVYPGGRFRPGSAIQRGSVQFLSLGPGDPSTPFGPSTKDAKRLPLDARNGFTLEVEGSANNDPIVSDGKRYTVAEWEKETGLKRSEYFATIPSIPLSYDNAKELFTLLAGPNVPTGWQGGLPLAYHVGPGPVEVTLSTGMEYQLRKIWNVIATIPGAVEPDRWVLMGNHRDAWVYGAVDPGSGTAATMETCRALGAAVKSGWKPRRTIYYASWDAEEYGLVGSTEWAEDHAKELNEKAVLMLNVDSAVSGPELSMSGVPSMRDLVLGAAGSIIDPRSGKSLKTTWLDAKKGPWAEESPLVADDPAWRKAPGAEHHDFVPQMGFLGSGSDFTAYVDHLAIPAADVGFHGGYGVYHSTYDDFNWMEKFGDPEFLSHATSARLYTLIMMRAAAAEVVPLTFTPYAHALREHVDELRLLVLRRARKAGQTAGAVFTELIDAVIDFQARAHALDETTKSLAKRDDIAAAKLSSLNDALTKVERAFLVEKGLPRRPWFRHGIYAPGTTTGYACWPLPAVRQAFEDKNKKELDAQIKAAALLIKHAATALEGAEKSGHDALAR
jgi:N-acetylated-alpha-linked acidic dipeptidase